jgi:hypothetical protein
MGIAGAGGIAMFGPSGINSGAAMEMTSWYRSKYTKEECEMAIGTLITVQVSFGVITEGILSNVDNFGVGLADGRAAYCRAIQSVPFIDELRKTKLYRLIG